MQDCTDILSLKNVSDMDKLMRIFDIDKENVKKCNPELYYALLAVRDNIKQTNRNMRKYDTGDFRDMPIYEK